MSLFLARFHWVSVGDVLFFINTKSIESSKFVFLWACLYFKNLLNKLYELEIWSDSVLMKG